MPSSLPKDLERPLPSVLVQVRRIGAPSKGSMVTLEASDSFADPASLAVPCGVLDVALVDGGGVVEPEGNVVALGSSALHATDPSAQVASATNPEIDDRIEWMSIITVPRTLLPKHPTRIHFARNFRHIAVLLHFSTVTLAPACVCPVLGLDVAGARKLR
jgi:hypothetical protein